MKRQRLLAPLTPLIVCAVVCAPAAAAQGFEGVVPASLSVAPVGTCALVKGDADAQGETTYDLKLAGFARKEQVRIESGVFSKKIAVSSNGSFVANDVAYGNYKVRSARGTVTCTKVARDGQTKPPGDTQQPPADKPADVTTVTVSVNPKTDIGADCNPKAKITFTAQITAASPGVAKYLWKWGDGSSTGGKIVFKAPGTEQVTIDYPDPPSKPGESLQSSGMIAIADGPTSQFKTFEVKCR